mmetsp:Transcript_7059/g.26731  ORF Transcript_7059/g.26731 Transcript_7059/m.26731 type:complete len:231 (-) Transcript_7059:696-1388(-)
MSGCTCITRALEFCPIAVRRATKPSGYVSTAARDTMASTYSTNEAFVWSAFVNPASSAKFSWSPFVFRNRSPDSPCATRSMTPQFGGYECGLTNPRNSSDRKGSTSAVGECTRAAWFFRCHSLTRASNPGRALLAYPLAFRFQRSSAFPNSEVHKQMSRSPKTCALFPSKDSAISTNKSRVTSGANPANALWCLCRVAKSCLYVASCVSVSLGTPSPRPTGIQQKPTSTK